MTSTNRVFDYSKPANASGTIDLRRWLSQVVAERRPVMPTGSDHSTRARITPLNRQGQPATSHPIEVRDFDARGITFHHETPLNDRRALVVLESPRLGRFAAEVDLTWCRFNRTGRYTSGGRFVQLVGKTA